MIALLKNGNFWLTLFVLNGLFAEVQPVPLGLSAALVVFLFVTGKLLDAWAWVQLSPRRQRVLTIALLWLLSGALIAYYFDKKRWVRRDEDGLLVVAAINLAAWLVPLLLYRLLRRTAEQARAAAAAAESAVLHRTRDAAQKRREDARASCEILYSLHGPEVADRFTRATFDDFVQRYLGDDRPPEYVEQRAQQLREIIQRHLERIEPPQKKQTLADLAQWFLNEKEQIEATALAAEDRATLLAQLEERYVRLQEKYLRSVAP